MRSDEQTKDKAHGHHAHGHPHAKKEHADKPHATAADQAPQGSTRTPHALLVVKAEYLAKIETQAEAAVQLQDRLVRTAADLDNYRKRAAKDKEDAIKFANESFLESLLPAIDSFELGIQSAAKATDASSIAQGMKMALTQLFQALGQNGVEPMDATGKKFDPNLHDAVSHADAPDAEEGTVVQQVRRGYTLKGRLLRPASVVVAKGKS